MSAKTLRQNHSMRKEMTKSLLKNNAAPCHNLEFTNCHKTISSSILCMPGLSYSEIIKVTDGPGFSICPDNEATKSLQPSSAFSYRYGQKDELAIICKWSLISRG